jgi:hypothetical protein
MEEQAVSAYCGIQVLKKEVNKPECENQTVFDKEIADEDLNQEALQKKEKNFIYNFWVCTYPNFESALYLNSSNIFESNEVNDQKEVVELNFFDSEGILFNSANIEFPTNEFLSLKISSFMASCKMQSGMKHARLQVKSFNQLDAKLRLYAKDTAQVLDPIRFISKVKPDFFALTFANDRMAYLAVTNQSASETEMRVKVFCSMSGLDLKLKIPAFAAKIFEISSLFPQILALKEERSFQAYLRITTKSDDLLGIQFYEQRVL